MCGMPRARRWTDDQLVAAVAASANLKEVCDALGLWAGGGTYRTLERHMVRLGVDTSHLAERIGQSPRQRRWTDEQLIGAVAECSSYADVLRRLGCNVNGGMHRHLVTQLTRLGLDTSHFHGQAWARGRRFPLRNARPLEDILTIDSTYTGHLRQRLVDGGLLPGRCQQCGITSWCGRDLTLHLDHINGNHTDNRLDNLRVLCPNCHSLTETYGRRKRLS
jgi:hypothetical protein